MELKPLYTALFLSTIISALPLEDHEEKYLNPRAKSYAVVNVDGGSGSGSPTTPNPAPAKTTTVVDSQTTTVEVTPIPSTAASSSVFASWNATAAATGTSLVTVVVTESVASAPTSWYDDGMWHTRYAVKTGWD